MHPITEKATDCIQSRLAALILNGIVQQSCDGLILVSSHFKDERRDTQEV
jgi:hypothetical protein